MCAEEWLLGRSVGRSESDVPSVHRNSQRVAISRRERSRLHAGID
jgi:hypothetical protein